MKATILLWVFNELQKQAMEGADDAQLVMLSCAWSMIFGL